MTTVVELEIAWYKSETGSSSKNYDDLKLAYFRQKADITTGTLADAQFKYYRSLGLVGSISDMEIAFWISQGATGKTYNDIRFSYFLDPTPPVVGVNIVDSFNRADSALLLGVTDTGELWTPDRGVWGISTNRAALITSVLTPNIATVPVPVTDYTIQVDLTVAGGLNSGGPVFRYVDLNNYWYIQANNSGTSRLREVVAGVDSIRSSGDGGLTAKVILTGNSVDWYIDDTQQSAPVNDAVVNGTRAGLEAYSNTTRLDNFSVVAA